VSQIVSLPAFCDAHVHFREPGQSHKETIASGCAAATHGGYTAVFTMPNLTPVSDSVEHLGMQLDLIEQQASIDVLPFAAITVGQLGNELTDMDALASMAVGFSDDGHGVQDADMMRAAMQKAAALGKVISSHEEDNSLLCGGYIHDGEYAKAHHHRGICSKSEWGPIERDVELAAATGCAFHICHISTAESVDIIRQAKASGVDVTCETAPHYLILDEGDLQEHGRFKMNPPLRSARDKEALIQGVLDGTIDMISTDHAPHSAQEKSQGLEGSPFGIVGLETAFPLMYTHFVRTGVLSLERLVELFSVNARKRFGLPAVDKQVTYCVWDLDECYTINPDEFASMGKATPFEGYEVYGRCLKTVLNARTVYER